MSGNPPSSGSSSGSAGGGASGSYGGSAGGDGGTDSCVLRFKTVLASPVPSVVASLSAGDVLVVLLQDAPPAVTACHPDGTIVGGITQDVLRLRSCIQQGYAYEAVVLSISGGAIQVQVSTA
jgi:hypothetical protein